MLHETTDIQTLILYRICEGMLGDFAIAVRVAGLIGASDLRVAALSVSTLSSGRVPQAVRCIASGTRTHNVRTKPANQHPKAISSSEVGKHF